MARLNQIITLTNIISTTKLAIESTNKSTIKSTIYSSIKSTFKSNRLISNPDHQQCWGISLCWIYGSIFLSCSQASVGYTYFYIFCPFISLHAFMVLRILRLFQYDMLHPVLRILRLFQYHMLPPVLRILRLSQYDMLPPAFSQAAMLCRVKCFRPRSTTTKFGRKWSKVSFASTVNAVLTRVGSHSRPARSPNQSGDTFNQTITIFFCILWYEPSNRHPFHAHPFQAHMHTAVFQLGWEKDRVQKKLDTI